MIFIESKAFTRRLFQLTGDLADEVLSGVQNDLLENPSRGDVVRGLGGIRKERSANPGRGKGKRGGYRYLFLYLTHKQHIHLLLLLDKDEQEDLTEEQRQLLRQLVVDIKSKKPKLRERIRHETKKGGAHI